MSFRMMNRVRRGSEFGFSLLEVLVVVVILSIVAGIGIPKYRDFLVSRSIEGMQYTLLSKFREAPPLSRALRKNVYVAVDMDNDKVWLEVDGALYGSKVPQITNADIKGIAHNTSPQTTGISYYRFSYWGTVYNETYTTPAVSYTVHIGEQGGAYNSSQPAEDFRSITLMTESGRAVGYTTGCFGSNPWGSWRLCSDLN